VIFTQHYESPLGGILLAADDTGLTGLWFEGQKYFARTLDAVHQEQETAVPPMPHRPAPQQPAAPKPAPQPEKAPTPPPAEEKKPAPPAAEKPASPVRETPAPAAPVSQEEKPDELDIDLLLEEIKRM